jgi:polysaccharide export outer membrane protein
MTAALAASLGVAAPALADEANDHSEYRLNPGDRIVVTVFGQSELSGDLMIDGLGEINLPFVGAIAVANLTVSECQQAVVNRLAEGILVKPAVNVRIAELRPLYILGDVRTPGAYPFRYGEMVKSAVAAAGGYGVAESAQSTAVSDYLTADERFRELNLQRHALVVRRARLEAQRDGKEKFETPAIPEIAGEGDAPEIIAAEKQTFDSQAEVMKAQVEQMRSQRPRLDAEIDAVRGQIAIERKQVEIIEKQSEQYSGLVKQGLGLANADMQLKLEQTSRESDIWRLEAEASRLQMDVGELDIKIQEVEATFKKQVIADLLDVQQRLRELEVTLQSARAIRDVRMRQVGGFAQNAIERTISVTRMHNGAETVIAATESTILAPGDIVEIKKSPPKDGLARSASDPAPRSERSAEVVSR